MLEKTKPQLRMLASGVIVIDDALPDRDRARIYQYLRNSNWKFGWKSAANRDTYSFWHLHFAGYRNAHEETPVDCTAALATTSLLIAAFWDRLKTAPIFVGHTLVRCYANGQPYGSDGTLHVDSQSPKSLTLVYYSHPVWDPDWGGETVIFTPDKSDILAACYPKPNRLLVFRGSLPHLARGVSRTCPELRMTLMFKTMVLDDSGKLNGVPAGAGENEPHSP